MSVHISNFMTPPSPFVVFLLGKFWHFWPPPSPFEETSFMNSPLEKALQRLLHGAMSSKIFRDWAWFVYSSFTFSELKKNYKQVWNCCYAKLWIRIRFQTGFNHIMLSYTQAQRNSRRGDHATLAKTEMIYPKNVRAKVAMNFTWNE